MVTVADNGRKAVQKLTDKKCVDNFDAVLMDIQMPEMDGYSATAEILKSNGKFKNIPIIAMTAYAFERDRKKCLEIGMNNVITKPFKQKDFLDMVVKWLTYNSN